jgi:hypothetical protein
VNRAEKMVFYMSWCLQGSHLNCEGKRWLDAVGAQDPDYRYDGILSCDCKCHEDLSCDQCGHVYEEHDDEKLPANAPCAVEGCSCKGYEVEVEGMNPYQLEAKFRKGSVGGESY